MSETMDKFEKQFIDMEVQSEGDVNNLMQQVADYYGLAVSVGLPQPAAHAVPTKENESEKALLSSMLEVNSIIHNVCF
ncbi:hypothetical protein Lal_00009832 [Lupinus albus]|uniref:Uncharacterized protein n=1 Tax=Lupinus albus TaxID=3870 RepID=A0A6A5LGP4_LUPAL|nr:hypothetical protein Lalb_Chr24g0396241 [Lupinus albus]KAF1859248.1 hypothetical protein Lal_00009832 [Lupinus albus]